MSRGFRKVWSVVTTLVVIAALLLALLLAGVRLIGLRVYVVLSGSMEPTYHTGSLIYVKKTDPFTLKTGDVITFMLDEDTLATHRIAGIVPDEDDPSVIRFRTKGDANANEDGNLVHYKNVVGVPVFTIPKLGYVANYIQHPPGLYVTIAVGAFLMLLMFMPELVSALKSEDEPGEAKAPKEKKPKKEKPAKEKPAKAKPLRNKPLPAAEAELNELPEEVPEEPGIEREPEYREFPIEREPREEQRDLRRRAEVRGAHELKTPDRSPARRGGSHVKGRHEK